MLYRRANFTSADMRESDFSGSTFNGAYLEKAVAYKANFTDSAYFVRHDLQVNMPFLDSARATFTSSSVRFAASGPHPGGKHLTAQTLGLQGRSCSRGS
ncbi:thylakoid lumenal protein chloroplastic-like protein, partial [Tanacetum coccineum]